MKNFILFIALSIFAFTQNSFGDNYTYLKGPQLAESNQSVASSSGTTTLTALSPMKTVITGTLTHTVSLPDASTIPTGYSYHIMNASTGSVEVKDFGGTTLETVLTKTDKNFILFTGGIWHAASGGSAGKTLIETSPLVITQDALTATFSIPAATTSVDGYLSQTDWDTFNEKENVLTFSSPLSRVANTVSIPSATTATSGYLSNTDWGTFNGKQDTLTFTPEDIANKSTDTALGTSDTLYPSQNAVKNYVDTHAGGKNVVGISPIVINQDATTATFTFGAADFIDFNTTTTPATSLGRIHWDQTAKSLAVDMDPTNNVQLQVGEEMYTRGLNATGSIIADGTVVYISGASGSLPTIAPATTSAYIVGRTIGVATQNIGVGAEGLVTTAGKVGSYNTSGFTAGQRLYISDVGAGALTATAPVAGILPVAFALNSLVDGSILVDVQPRIDSEALDPTGFSEPENIILNYDSTTRKVTLTGNVRALWRGKIVDEFVTGYVSPAHAATNGTWYLYYDGVNTAWSQTPWTFDKIQIAMVMYDGVNNIGIREVHGMMPWQAHRELHQIAGTYVAANGGGDLTGYTTASTTATAKRPDISATSVYDEDLLTVNSALTSKLYTKFTLTGTSTGVYTVETAEIVPVSGNTPYYNLNTAGTWSQSLMTNNTYQAVFLAAIPVSSSSNSQKYRYLWVQGQTLNTSLQTIQSLTPSDLNLDGLVVGVQEIVFIAKVIINYVAGGTNNWNITSIQKLTGSRFSQIAVSGGTYLSSVSTDANFTGTGGVTSPLALAPTVAITTALGIGNAAPATTLHVTGDSTTTGYTYMGGLPSVDGTYRTYVSGAALITEKRESGVWVEAYRIE